MLLNANTNYLLDRIRILVAMKASFPDISHCFGIIRVIEGRVPRARNAMPTTRFFLQIAKAVAFVINTVIQTEQFRR